MNKLATAILCFSLATVAGAGTLDERLSTTLLGLLEPGGEPRLAVSWDGPAGARDELVVDGRRLVPGIEVVELELPAEALEGAEPELWVRVRERGHRRPDQGEAAAKILENGCAWQPGYHMADLDGSTDSLAIYDDGTGPALYVGGNFGPRQPLGQWAGTRRHNPGRLRRRHGRGPLCGR